MVDLRSLFLRHIRQQTRFPTRAAIDRLSADLGLTYRGQDWELLAADSRRVIEFLDYYDTRQLNDDERFTLMSLIIASFDDCLSAGQEDVLQDRIVARLTARFDVLNYLVQYWALPDEPDEGAADGVFHFTPIARNIMQSKYGEREYWPRTPFAIRCADKLLPEQGVCDHVSIANNRDGTFELWWSKIAGRDSGSREFSSIDEAVEFARQQFGVATHAWSEIK